LAPGLPPGPGEEAGIVRQHHQRGRNHHLLRPHAREASQHQGETYRGWLLGRSGPLFDEMGKRINGERFLEVVQNGLNAYCDELAKADWNGELWQKCRFKMKAIIDNCEDPSPLAP
jgi:hypothetical protein